MSNTTEQSNSFPIEPPYHTVRQSDSLKRYRSINNYPEGKYMHELNSPSANIETLAERDGMCATANPLAGCSLDIEFLVGSTIVGIESRIRLANLFKAPAFIRDNIVLFEKYGLTYTFIYKYLVYVQNQLKP